MRHSKASAREQKNWGDRPEPKWHGCVYIEVSIPFHSKQCAVLWMDWNVAESMLHVYLGKPCPSPCAQYLVGPLPPATAPKIQVNRFGVIPKRNQPGKWRLIADLSHPEQWSVDNGINPDWCGVHYASVNDAVQILLASITPLSGTWQLVVGAV